MAGVGLGLDSARRPSYDLLIIFYPRRATMGRTPGATNRTPRELRAEAKRLEEKASHIEKTEALKKELEEAKANRKGRQSDAR